MSRATLTILGLYNYDTTIFTGLIAALPSPERIPTDYPIYKNASVIDSETLINNLLLECAEFEFLYPDAEFAKFAIKTWASKCSDSWQCYYNTLWFKYSPIWNKDGESGDIEKYSGSVSALNELNKTSESVRVTEGNSQNDTAENSNYAAEESSETSGSKIGVNTVLTTDTVSGTEETKVSAFNSSSYEPREKKETAGSSSKDESGRLSEDTRGEGKITDSGNGVTTRTESGKTAGSSSDNANEYQNGKTDTDTEYKKETTHYDRGNIGVTMTQDMIEAERKIISNMYDVIIADFKQRFCLLIY